MMIEEYFIDLWIKIHFLSTPLIRIRTFHHQTADVGSQLPGIGDGLAGYPDDSTADVFFKKTMLVNWKTKKFSLKLW